MYVRVLTDNQTPSTTRESEEEREESITRVNPPPLTHPVQPTLEEKVLTSELENLRVKNPLL